MKILRLMWRKKYSANYFIECFTPEGCRCHCSVVVYGSTKIISVPNAYDLNCEDGYWSRMEYYGPTFYNTNFNTVGFYWVRGKAWSRGTSGQNPAFIRCKI